mmetsp:Transcript_91108/g.162160  ORF Transcript_91108/g.162160 Transcript_91108/m.162160 type:complete len:179 (+) Transcript_91108:67-603(+)
MPYYPNEIEYSEKYEDDDHVYEYRHVILDKPAAQDMMRISGPEKRLLEEDEWRRIGVRQSRGWQHYHIHRPEPHVLLFRRPVGTDAVTGRYPDVPDIVVAVDAESQVDGSVVITCTSLAGTVLHTMEAYAGLVADVYVLLLSRFFKVPVDQVKVVLPASQLLSDFPSSAPLLGLLGAS